MKNFKNILFILSFNERSKLYLLLFMMFLTSFIDMLGVASIFPFIAILTNPLLLETNVFINYFFEFTKLFGVKNNDQFFFLLGLLLFILIVVTMIMKVFTNFLQITFTSSLEYTLGKRLLENYINQTYSWFLNKNHNDLIKNILSEINHIIEISIYPFADLISKTLSAILLLALLLLIDTALASMIFFSLGGVYGLLYYFLKNLIGRIGNMRLENNHLRYRVLNQAFRSIKETKIRGLEFISVQLFSNSALKYAKSISSAHMLSQLPRFFLEGIAFGGIMIILIHLINQKGNITNALPIISLYTFAGYRLMPSLQGIYSAFTHMKYMKSSLNIMCNEIRALQKTNVFKGKKKKLEFNESIVLKNIYYSYPNTSSAILKDISLTIPVKSKIAFTGPSGCGKSTLIDLISGLIEPQKGRLEIDKKVITQENLGAWQSGIGYVPQQVYLYDNTIASNIAFGLENKDINYDIIEKVCEIVNLNKFIISLPNKYDTVVGEDGIRLSGGQRQRIGIARALYQNPKILLLDEATNALDNKTEQLLMNRIYESNKNLTIIFISHRLNILQNFDYIFKLDKGRIISEGKYNELLKHDYL